MEISFKQASADSIPEILEMMKDFNQLYDYPFNPELNRKNLNQFINNKELGNFWLISSGNIIAGYLVLAFGFSFEHKGRDAFIDELYLKSEFRNKGIGGKTIDFILEEAKKSGINAVHLEVEEFNHEGNRLYLKKGFESSGRILLSKKIN